MKMVEMLDILKRVGSRVKDVSKLSMMENKEEGDEQVVLMMLSKPGDSET